MSLAGIVNSLIKESERRSILTNINSTEEAKSLALQYATRDHNEGFSGQLTKNGSTSWKSDVTSRSPGGTKVDVDKPFTEGDYQCARDAAQLLQTQELVSMYMKIGSVGKDKIARFIIPRNRSDILAQISMLFDIVRQDELSETKPDYTIVFSPDSNGPILREVSTGVHLNCQTDYMGEGKKGVFTQLDYDSKIHNLGIFLHAGARFDRINMNGRFVKYLVLPIGLSGTGKSTTTCVPFARMPGESSWLIQDDGGTLTPNGSFYGFEGKGLFIKTDGLDPKEQEQIYRATMRRHAMLLNVRVDERGHINFQDDYCKNGRAVIRREDMEISYPKIYITGDEVGKVIILQLTRNEMMGAISKLTPEQATAYMALGESQETGAADRTQVGKFKREFFYDPFASGIKKKHADIFYEIIKGLGDKVEFLIANTGIVGAGDSSAKVRLADSLACYNAVLRGEVEWEEGPFGLLVPKNVQGVDSKLITPHKLFSQPEYESRAEALYFARQQWLENLGICEQIRDSVKRL